MFIQTESTPNAQTLKFIPGVAVMESGTAFYTGVEEANASPLAEALFSIPEVSAVLLGSDFIAVTKHPEALWEVVKPIVLTLIMEHFVAGKPVFLAKDDSESPITRDEDPLVRQIRELIDTRVRPSVAMDGGDIIYHDFKDGVVYLELHGACSGCPSSTITLKQGIENMLKHYVPEIIAVEAVSQ